jgi:DNA-binding NarL/FixJ family response regulator
VAIADDHHLVRTGFRMILNAEPDMEVVGEATNGYEAVTLARDLRPDVFLIDVRMPDLDGIEATRQITTGPQGPPTRVVILTTFDLDEYVFDALRAGASGFLLKDIRPTQLASAVRMVAAGDALLAPAITRRLIERFAGEVPPVATVPALGQLTTRELEVFRLVGRGLSNAEIAAQLLIAETTVKTHVTRVLMKLNLRDRVQAVVLAYETRVVNPGGASLDSPK